MDVRYLAAILKSFVENDIFINARVNNSTRYIRTSVCRGLAISGVLC